MFIFTLTVGILALLFGLLMMLRFQTLQAWSRMLSASVWSEAWISRHRKTLGFLLILLAAYLVGAAFWMARLRLF